MTAPRPEYPTCPLCGKARAEYRRGICRPCYRDPAQHAKLPPFEAGTQEPPPPPAAEPVALDPGKVTAEAMRKVWGQPKSDDRGPTENHLRAMLEEDKYKYLEYQRKLEKDEKADAASDPAACPPDPTTAELRSRIARLLRPLGEP